MQEDMDDDDIMLLDTYDNVFLWVGSNSNAQEKKEAMRTAVVRKTFCIDEEMF